MNRQSLITSFLSGPKTSEKVVKEPPPSNNNTQYETVVEPTSSAKRPLPELCAPEDSPPVKSNRVSRRRRILDDESSDEETTPQVESVVESKRIQSIPRQLSDNLDSLMLGSPSFSDHDENMFTSPPSKKQKSRARTSLFNSRSFDSPNMRSENKEERHSWLEKRKDKKGRTVDDPDYDPRTMYIPPRAFEKLTSFEKQYWNIKRDYMDVVIFFKKGKFYELFEADADIGHKELDLKMTERVNMRMTGVPESTFHRWAAKLVAKGYKVGRVEQMESAKVMARDARQGKKKSKVCERELCQILTSGTLTNMEMLPSHTSNYLLAFKEDAYENRIGVCFLDAAAGQFTLTDLRDDIHRTQLETLLERLHPKEILIEKGNLSRESRSVMKRVLRHPLMNILDPGVEFLGGERAYVELSRECYFGGDEGKWPAVVVEARSCPLVMESLGAVLWYLQKMKIDEDILALNKFSWYSADEDARVMWMDGRTVANLELISNQRDGGEEGTLISLIDRCRTSFGKRLLRKWLCHPLANGKELRERFSAVEDILQNEGIRDELRSLFHSLPDLERTLSKLHQQARLKKDVYMVDNGDAKVVRVLTDVIRAFRLCFDAYTGISNDVSSLTSLRLSELLTVGLGFPDVGELLSHFENSFDHNEARRTGVIITSRGVEEEYDRTCDLVAEVEAELEDHLEEVRAQFKCRKIRYVPLGKEPYQLEIPVEVTKYHTVPSSFQVMSQTKNVRRYWSPRTRDLVNRWEDAVVGKEEASRNILKRMLQEFCTHLDLWQAGVSSLAETDCLLSLAELASDPAMTKPEFVDREEFGDLLDVRDLRHPCVASQMADFIPNDTIMCDVDHPPIILLTGPNMGGKSTLLRQVCLAVIMAQVGCFVPCSSMRLAPVDKIFTRVGAMDRIVSGESTFMVELSETSQMLAHATHRSLVILDELGRGTSTYDGHAIAYSVLMHLAKKIACRTLFSTHYHSLTEELRNNEFVGLYHMQCEVDQESQRVLFLYKLTHGVCPKSYGTNVALLAGVPPAIVDRAAQVAACTEEVTTHEKKEIDISRLYEIVCSEDMDDIQACRNTICCK